MATEKAANNGLRCYVVRGTRKSDNGFDYAAREKVAAAVKAAMTMQDTGNYTEVVAFKVRSGNIEFDANAEKD